MIEVVTERIEKDVIDAWYDEWQQLQAQIHVAHEARDGSAKELMEQGIVLFEGLLKSASNVDHIDSKEQYELMPINGMERFIFIQLNPGQYACYRQLDELFKETKKRCARLRLKK